MSSQLARTLQFTDELENYGRFLIRHSTIARKAYAVSVPPRIEAQMLTSPRRIFERHLLLRRNAFNSTQTCSVMNVLKIEQRRHLRNMRSRVHVGKVALYALDDP